MPAFKIAPRVLIGAPFVMDTATVKQIIERHRQQQTYRHIAQVLGSDRGQ